MIRKDFGLMNRKNSELVYSTNPNWQEHAETEHKEEDSTSAPRQTVYIERDRKKRAGKVVTVISGVKGDLKPLLKELQKLCGSGGTVKAGQIEIQGDHREKIAVYLGDRGFNIKYKGG